MILWYVFRRERRLLSVVAEKRNNFSILVTWLKFFFQNGMKYYSVHENLQIYQSLIDLWRKNVIIISPILEVWSVLWSKIR